MKKKLHLLLILVVTGWVVTVTVGCTVGGTGASDSASSGGSSSETSISGSITGKVAPEVGASSAIIANATISVESHPEISSKTDSDGNYVINNVDQGEYTLYISSALLAGQSVHKNSSSEYGVKISNVVVESKTPTNVSEQILKKTGSVSGIVDFFQNPNNLDKTGTDVYIPGTHFSSKTSSTGAFTLANLPEGTYNIRFDRLGFQSFTLVNQVITSGQITDIGTKWIDLSKGPQGGVSLDNQLSDYLSMQSSGASLPVFKNRIVPLKINYNADAVWMKISDESAFLNKSLQTVNTSKSWSFTTDGLKRIYIQFYDLNALPSSVYYIEFFVDTETPSLASTSIMNGWEIVSNHLQVPITISATDSGSGIKEVMMSNTCVTFSGSQCTSINGSWVSYSKDMVWDLLAGDGVKTVYTKLRDFTNLESSIKSDSINKNSFTRIYATTYLQDVILSKQQSPYVLSDDTIFSGSLNIEAGVTVTLLNNKHLIAKGPIRAIGGSALSNNIVFQTETGACDAKVATIDLSQGDPGVSELNAFQYTSFLGDINIILNGGNLDHNVFNSACTDSSSRGSITKIRTDNLIIESSTFNHWTRINVSDGDGNTQIKSNTGSFSYFLKQDSTATHTVVLNNTNLAVSQDVYEISNGAINPIGNSFSGSCSNGYKFSGATAGQTISVDDLTPPNCTFVFGGSNNGSNIYINNSVITNCTQFVGIQGSTGSVNLTNINASCEIISSSSGGLSVQFTDSTLKATTAVIYCGFMDNKCSASIGRTTGTSSVWCSHTSLGSYCDLFYRVAQGPSVAMIDSLNIQNTTISCGNRCRGFVYIEPSNVDQSGNTKTAAFSLTLAGNTWIYPNSETQRRPYNTTNWTGGGVSQFETASPSTYVPNSSWIYSLRTPGSAKYISVTPSVTYSDQE